MRRHQAIVLCTSAIVNCAKPRISVGDGGTLNLNNSPVLSGVTIASDVTVNSYSRPAVENALRLKQRV